MVTGVGIGSEALVAETSIVFGPPAPRAPWHQLQLVQIGLVPQVALVAEGIGDIAGVLFCDFLAPGTFQTLGGLAEVRHADEIFRTVGAVPVASELFGNVAALVAAGVFGNVAALVAAEVFGNVAVPFAAELSENVVFLAAAEPFLNVAVLVSVGFFRNVAVLADA